jgi:hypothetical protein
VVYFFSVAFCVCDIVVSVTYTQYLVGQHVAHILSVINHVWFTQIAMSVLVFVSLEVWMCVCVREREIILF